MSITNKIFCTAPFTTLRIESYSTNDVIFKPGCVYSVQNNISTLDEYINGSEMIDHRQNLLFGDTPSIGCRLCSDPENMGLTSVRQQLLNKPWSSDQQSIKMLDIFFSNTCNLGCLMCGPEWSSFIAEERFKIGELNQRIKIKDNVDVILATIDKLPDLECISFLGGEFFFFKANDKIIEKIIEKKLKCTITTNCTTASGVLYEKLKSIDKLEFRFSVDGVGAVNDFIRYPSEWTQIENNIKCFQKDFKKAEKCISTVVQPLNLQFLPELFEWANRLYLPVHMQVISSPKKLSWEILTVQERNKILNSLEIDKFKLTKQQIQFFDQIHEGIFEPPFNDDIRNEGISFLSKILHHRKYSPDTIKKQFGVLEDLHNEIITKINNENM
jgi:MoaA/NifB/PqqE/SkfB family radical SAM enzyme